MPIRLVVAAAFAICALCYWAAHGVAAGTGAQRDGKGMWVGLLDEHPAIEYAIRPARDPIAGLNRALDAGQAALTFEPQSGYLRSVLRALQVPVESQMLVLSRTGVQRAFSSPANPRALYFNDAVAVGFIRGSPFLELMAQDPEQGAVFYTLDQRATARPAFSRQTSCLTCHVASATLEVPGFMTRSLRAGTDGTPKLRLGSHHVDHRTPFEERWGGWFVTGTHGRMRHLGNMVTGAADAQLSLVPGGALNARALDGAVDLTGYLSPHSDVVALAVFDHQTRALNLLTRVAWEARVAAHEGRLAVDSPPIAALVVELVDYLLFVDEAPIDGGLRGTSGFAEWFSAQGVRDARGRSLHQLDLGARLMRYPCSYTIGSPAFDALAPPVKAAVYRRLWHVLSGGDSAASKTRQGSSGGLTPDNIGVEYTGVVYGIAESPRERGLIWVGTNDGLVQVTRDAGKSWTNVTKNLPGLPPWGSLRSIAPSKYDAGTAYLTVDFHQVNNRDPFIYKTTDYGRTWKAITNGIPKSMLSYAKVIVEDPVRRGLLYVGTENAIYTSFDDGENWQPLQMDLPHAPVSGIVVQTHFNDLVISTYGRGFFILDDITPLQQLTPQVLAADAHLFAPRAAYRFRPITAPSTTYDDPTVGENPRYGASINYYLKGAPAGPVTVTILDGKNQIVRTLPGTTRAGLNRIYWDLRSDPTAELRLRTNPLYAPQAQFRPGPDGTRPAPGTGQLSLLMPPGTYTVKLAVGGREMTEALTVRKDPNSEGTEADIDAQTRVVTSLRGHAAAAAAMVNQIELIRSQLEGLDRLGADAATKTAVNELAQQLIDTEMNLVDLRQTGTGQDGVRFGSKLMSKINYLANGVSGSDYKPTDQHLAAEKVIADEVKKVQALVDALRGRILGGFNEQLKSKNLPPIVVPTPR